MAVLRRVHAVLIRMVRSSPETAAEAWNIVVDCCSVRAKRGGAFTAPNPTDRGKQGTKHHLAVTTDGLPVAAWPSAANIHDTRLFPDLLRLALIVCVGVARRYADAGYDSGDNRRLCLREGIQPIIRKIGEPLGEPHGSGLGKVRGIVEHANAWLLANNRLERRREWLRPIVDGLLTAASIFLVAARLAEF